MRLLRELLLDVVVGAGRIGDVEPALVVEGGGDRPVDQRRPGDPLDREPAGSVNVRPSSLTSPARVASSSGGQQQ